MYNKKHKKNKIQSDLTVFKIKRAVQCFQSPL